MITEVVQQQHGAGRVVCAVHQDAGRGGHIERAQEPVFISGHSRSVRIIRSNQDSSEPGSLRWALTLTFRSSRALIEARGGVIVAEFFDVDKSRSIAWQRRPRATALLAELKNPHREFNAVVVSEPHRAFYGNQYGLTFPIFVQ